MIASKVNRPDWLTPENQCESSTATGGDLALKASSSCPFSVCSRQPPVETFHLASAPLERTKTRGSSAAAAAGRRMNQPAAAQVSLKRSASSPASRALVRSLKRRYLADMNVSLARYSSHLLARRGMPILFILVSSLIIVNTKCDQVGSANEDSSQSKLKPSNHDLLDQDELAEKGSSAGQKGKVDPLSMLREIYLDQNQKIITMLMPPEGDPVQKFHPNGRYGRRSVDNLAESHAELGKLSESSSESLDWSSARVGEEASRLTQPSRPPAPPNAVYNEPLASSSSLSSSSSSSSPFPSPSLARAASSSELRGLLHKLSREFSAGGRLANRYGAGPAARADNNQLGPLQSNGAALVNYPLEMNKLLKCNYSGITSLYWCSSPES